jgi:hypothetical protein
MRFNVAPATKIFIPQAPASPVGLESDVEIDGPSFKSMKPENTFRGADNGAMETIE